MSADTAGDARPDGPRPADSMAGNGDAGGRIVPCLWFDRAAEEAVGFYVGLLPGSRIVSVLDYAMDMPGGRAGDVLAIDFTLAGAPYQAINGGAGSSPTPAVSFAVACDDQAEIDRLWEALADGGTPMRCGWIADRWGFAWQIVPRRLMQLMREGDPARRVRVVERMLTMEKLDIAGLEAAGGQQGVGSRQ